MDVVSDDQVGDVGSDPLGEIGQHLAQSWTPALRSMTISFGLPVQIAQTLQLTWTGTTFRATSSHPGLKDYEYGDGKKPPRAPVRKTLNRLMRQLEAAMRDDFESSDYLPEAVF